MSANNCAITTLGVGFEPATYVRSSAKHTALMAAAANVEALDTSGVPDAAGKILGAGIGMSTSSHVFSRVRTILTGLSTAGTFDFRDCAQSGKTADSWEDPLDSCWANALSKVGSGNTAAQVQFVVVMITQAFPATNGAMTLAQLRAIYDNIFTNFPNCQFVIWDSHPYTGYTTEDRLPGTYCHGDQALLAGSMDDADLNDLGPSDYYAVYCDGETPNPYTELVGSEGAIDTDYAFSMACADYLADDGVHMESSGLEKVAQSIVHRWLDDPVFSFMWGEEEDEMSNSRYQMGTMPAFSQWSGGSTTNGIRIDADTEQFAAKFFPQTTSPITHVDFRIDISAGTASVNWVMEIQSDNNDAPSGTVLGAATAGFTLSADDWTGAKALATPTGALTVGTPIWLVFRRLSGTSLTGSIFAQPYRYGVSELPEKLRHYNGSNWTTTAVAASPGQAVLTHADGSFTGFPMTTGDANPTGVDVFGTNRQGLRFRMGARLLLCGTFVRFAKVGAPSALVATVSQPALSRSMSATFAAANIDHLTNSFMAWAPFLIYPGHDAFVVFTQDGGGGDASNYYRIRSGAFNTGGQPYLSAVASDRWRFVTGTNTDASLLSPSGTDLPMMSLIVQNFENQLQRANPRMRGLS